MVGVALLTSEILLSEFPVAEDNVYPKWPAGNLEWNRLRKTMKAIIDPKLQDSVLQQWRGAGAKIWIFDVSLKRLGVRLLRLKEAEVIYIVGITCQHIVGPFSWDNANISIVSGLKDKNGEAISHVIDRPAGFSQRPHTISHNFQILC